MGGKGLLEDGVVSAEPDMVARVDAELRDVLLEVAQSDSRFTELVKSLEMSVVSFLRCGQCLLSQKQSLLCADARRL